MKLHFFLTLHLLLLLMVPRNVAAQTQKGTWTTGGLFQFEQNQFAGTSYNSILLQPELGYAFFDRWMVWGQLTIALRNQFTEVGHKAAFRYAFMKKANLEAYAGLQYGFAEQTFFFPSGGSSNRKLMTVGPIAGYLFFLNSNVALDAGICYPLVRKFIVGESVSYQNGGIECKLGLRFFFDSKLPKDTSYIFEKLQKGNWLIGGAVALGGGGDFGFSNDNMFNEFTPYVGVLLSSRWMMGTHLLYRNTSNLEEYYFGLKPFSRFYFFQKNKKMIYGELSSNIQYRYLKEDVPLKGLANANLSVDAGIGFSRWILPGIAIDFFLGGEWGKIRPRFFEDQFTYQKVIMRVGLESYF